MDAARRPRRLITHFATSVLMGVIITGSSAPTTAAATRGTNPDGVIAAASLGPTELVDDPGFEEGPAHPSWQQEGTLVATFPLITTEHPFAGIYGAWLCGYSTCDDRLWQVIDVPQDVESASLTYMFQIGTEGPVRSALTR